MKKLLAAAVLAVTVEVHGACAPDSIEHYKAFPFPAAALPAEPAADIPEPEQPAAPPEDVNGPEGRPVSPKPDITPGKLCSPEDTDFDGHRYPERIAHCARNVPYSMKVKVARDYGVRQSDWGNYEFDHLLPLAIGGNSAAENLWPQPRGEEESGGKDKLEQQLYIQLSKGEITQKEAVKRIYDWFKDYVEKTQHPAQFKQMLKTRLML
ncbi:MAG: hypothetical protein WC421_00455 [Elusimicrobiales bacterium]